MFEKLKFWWNSAKCATCLNRSIDYFDMRELGIICRICSDKYILKLKQSNCPTESNCIYDSTK